MPLILAQDLVNANLNHKKPSNELGFLLKHLLKQADNYSISGVFEIILFKVHFGTT